MEVDPNLVIDLLVSKVAELTKQNALLQAQAITLMELTKDKPNGAP